ncbi:MAG: bifunctional 5,10-methylenetetrahydrofolate dehydrogenase/5,10-methenyltetrahydrofolate cyclohydrolase [Janthinobacterium lividum]
MNNIINCKDIAQNILLQLSNEVRSIRIIRGLVPTLAILMIGENSASLVYVKNKIDTAYKVGIKTILINLPELISTDKLLQEIEILNSSPGVSGIIVQLPLPPHIDRKLVLMSINPKKDVDGFHPLNVGYLNTNFGNGFVPGTALGIMEIINHLKIDLIGADAVIIGRSNLVGKPTSSLLLNKDCSVTICHSKTKNLAEITRRADLIISAMGKPKFLDAKFFTSKNIVIDVGINRDPVSKKVCGDVDFEKVQHIVKFITPVPGGVGPMTVGCLLRNTLKAFLEN